MRRPRQCQLDALEGRNLLSITPILGLLGPKIVATALPSAGASTSGDSSMTNVANAVGSGITSDTSAPRPNEVARRQFLATFSGRVQQQLPRLYDQQQQFYILAPGNTNQFLHGTIQMRLYTPSGLATPYQNTGTFSISDRSTQSGAVILADLTGDPTQVDHRGRPTHLNFVLNGGGGSGGIYASSVGSGTVDIAYQGNIAKVLVRGSIFIQGVGEPLNVFQSNTHH